MVYTESMIYSYETNVWNLFCSNRCTFDIYVTNKGPPCIHTITTKEFFALRDSEQNLNANHIVRAIFLISIFSFFVGQQNVNYVLKFKLMIPGERNV